MLMFIAGDRDQPSMFTAASILAVVQAATDAADVCGWRKFCADFAVATPWGYLPLVLEKPAI